jgi:hypothetical protein
LGEPRNSIDPGEVEIARPPLGAKHFRFDLFVDAFAYQFHFDNQKIELHLVPQLVVNSSLPPLRRGVFHKT